MPLLRRSLLNLETKHVPRPDLDSHGEFTEGHSPRGHHGLDVLRAHGRDMLPVGSGERGSVRYFAVDQMPFFVQEVSAYRFGARKWFAHHAPFVAVFPILSPLEHFACLCEEIDLFACDDFAGADEFKV